MRTSTGALRPRSIDAFIGQEAARQKLGIFLAAATQREESLDHVLLAGPPGLGKTSLARIIANELEVGFHATSGPVIERKGDLAAILTALEPRDVLFIDEIHRLGRAVEEVLYPAMEDFEIDVIIGQGPSARTLRLDLPPFTLVGRHHPHGLALGTAAADASASSSGSTTTPTRSWRASCAARRRSGARDRRRRRARDRLARAGDAAHRQPAGAPGPRRRAGARGARHRRRPGRATRSICSRSTRSASRNWTARILRTLALAFEGRPVGLGTLADSVGEAPDTIEDVYEPFLLQEGLIARTPRGRVAMPKAYRHLGLEPPSEQALF